jgi:hypothetical protein
MYQTIPLNEQDTLGGSTPLSNEPEHLKQMQQTPFQMNQNTFRWNIPSFKWTRTLSDETDALSNEPEHFQMKHTPFQMNQNIFIRNRPPLKWTRQFLDEPDHPVSNHATLRGIRPPQVYQITLRCTKTLSLVPDHRQQNQNLTTSWKDLSVERRKGLGGKCRGGI